MNCSTKIAHLDATVGSTFVFSFRLKDDAGEVTDITGYRVLFAAKSEAGEVLLNADSQGENPGIELDAEDGATITVQVPESMTPQVADFNVLLVEGTINLPVIRGKLTILSQIADPTP